MEVTASPAATLTARERDAASVAGLLARARLVTLTGPVGVGKSRLAGLVAAGGGWRAQQTADLRDARDDEAAAQRILAAEARLPEAGPRDVGGRSLLVVDNCDLSLGTVASQVAAVLARRPQALVLVTSRECLGISEEMIFPVRPLPPAEAVSFFAARVAAQHGGVPPEISPEIRQVCESLDGLPLALELAAAQATLLTPAQILERAGEAIRFTRPTHAGEARHRSLHSALDWCTQVLTDSELVLLLRLSVFAGTFSLDSAERVCADERLVHGEVLQALAGLVARSLVDCDPTGSRARYRLLRVVRQYAGELLDQSGEAEILQRNRLDHATACPESLSIADLGEAARWCAGHGTADDGLRLAAAAAPHWLLAGRLRDGVAWLAAALARADADGGAGRHEVSYARALLAKGMLDGALARPEEAERAAADAGALCGRLGDDGGRLWAGVLSGLSMLSAQPHVAARRIADAARELPSDSPWSPAAAAVHALAAAEAGQLGEAHDVAMRALEAAEGGSPEIVTAVTLLAAGRVERKLGRLSTATAMLARAEAMASGPRALGVRAVILAEAGRLALDRGRAEAGRLAEAKALAVETGSPVLLAAVLDVEGRTGLQGGREHAAQVAFAHLIALSKETGAVHAAIGILGLGQVALAGGAASAAWTLVEEAHAIASAGAAPELLARTLQAVGDCAWTLGDAARAWAAYHRALGLRADAGLAVAAVESLESLACLALEQGRTEYGTRLLCAVDGLRDAHGSERTAVARDRCDKAAAIAAGALDADRIRELRAEGARLSLSAAAAYACRQRGPRRRGVGWVSLTPAERQVADLAATGLTNREIGEALFSSPRTVQAHLSHVFAKLGIGSRKMLAAEVQARSRHLPPRQPQLGGS